MKKSFVGSSLMTGTSKTIVAAALALSTCVCLCVSPAAAQTVQPSAPASQPLSLDQLAQHGAESLANAHAAKAKAFAPQVVQGYAAAAIKAFSTLSEAQPNNTQALLGLAEAYLVAGNSLQAVEIYNRCRKLSPGDWRPDFGLGTVYLQTNYHRLARPFLERALRLAPNQPQSRGRVAMNLALCYKGLHQTADALSMARQALALDPTNIEVRRLLISLYVDAERFDDSLAEVQATADMLRDSMAKGPDDGTLAAQLLQILSMRVELLQAKIQAQPDDPSLRVQMVDALEQVAQADQVVTYHNALAHAEAALAKAPQDPDVLFVHARLQHLVGRPAKAIEDLQALLKIAPNDTRARQLLARIQAPSTQAAAD